MPYCIARMNKSQLVDHPIFDIFWEHRKPSTTPNRWCAGTQESVRRKAQRFPRLQIPLRIPRSKVVRDSHDRLIRIGAGAPILSSAQVLLNDELRVTPAATLADQDIRVGTRDVFDHHFAVLGLHERDMPRGRSTRSSGHRRLSHCLGSGAAHDIQAPFGATQAGNGLRLLFAELVDRVVVGSAGRSHADVELRNRVVEQLAPKRGAAHVLQFREQLREASLHVLANALGHDISLRKLRLKQAC